MKPHYFAISSIMSALLGLKIVIAQGLPQKAKARAEAKRVIHMLVRLVLIGEMIRGGAVNLNSLTSTRKRLKCLFRLGVSIVSSWLSGVLRRLQLRGGHRGQRLHSQANSERCIRVCDIEQSGSIS